MTLTDSQPSRTATSHDAEVLFREARRRRRRRRLISVIVLFVVAAVVATLVTTGASPRKSVTRTKPPKPVPPQSVGLPTGTVQALGSAGPLAVNATGSLFVVDAARHEVLVRLTNGAFRVVAGDGTGGFLGDGGPAIKAELSDVADIAFGPNGDLYLADGNRVRVVDRQGIISTVAGDGSSGRPVSSGTPARSASLGPVGSVTVSPTGLLYLSTASQLMMLGSNDELHAITAMGQTLNSPYAGSAPLNSFGQIAADGQGDIYASSLNLGWSVYRITPDRRATYLGSARGSGGTLADVQVGPGGSGFAADGGTVVQAEGNQLVPFHSLNDPPGQQFFYMKYFAFSPSGALYADNVDGAVFSRYQEIVRVSNGAATVLWKRAVKKP